MVAALALLAVVAVVLSGIALLVSRADRGEENPGPPPTFGSTTPTTTAPPTTETPQPPASTVAAPDRVLAIGAQEGHVVRGATGSCGSAPATLEVSSDGGAQWRGASLTDLGGGEILAVDAGDPSVTRMVYLGADCEPQLARSFVGGADWEPTSGVDAAWFLDPGEPGSANSPDGPVALPCAAVSLAASSERGIALCDDASVTVTTDFGSSWSTPLAAAGVVAVTLSGSGFAVAVDSDGECRGVQVKRFIDGTFGSAGACLEAEVAAGAVAIAGSPRSDVLYAWAGDEFARSEDGGSSWT